MLWTLFSLPKLLIRLLFSSAGRAFITSLSIWLLTFIYCRRRYWRDPHSTFFPSGCVYDLEYSAYRASQVEVFISSPKSPNSKTRMGSSHPEICAEYVTAKRETKQHVDVAIGSLLEGLMDQERARLHLYVLFGNTDPTAHPSWKRWLDGAVDEVGSGGVNETTHEHLRGLGKERNWYKKGVLFVSPHFPKHPLTRE